METLLIINSLLVGVCVYFIRDFHIDFKTTAKSVQRLQTKIGELDTKVTTKNEAIEKRLDKLEK